MRLPELAATLLTSPDQFSAREGILARTGYVSSAAPSWAMRLMHTRAIARIYDPLWRPAVIRPFSAVSSSIENEIIECHVDPVPGIRMLDLCCGTAHVGRRWAERGAEVLAVDVSWAMLSEARRRCASDRLVLVHADAGEVTAKRGSFDVAVCFAALHLLSDPEQVIGRAAEALTPEGFFFAWVATQRGLLAQKPVRYVASRTGLHAWPTGSLLSRMEQQGFEIVGTHVFGAIELAVGRRHSK